MYMHFDCFLQESVLLLSLRQFNTMMNAISADDAFLVVRRSLQERLAY